MDISTFVSAGKVNDLTAREGVSSFTPRIEYSGFNAEFAFNITGYSIDVGVGSTLEEEELIGKPDAAVVTVEKGCILTVPSEIHSVD